MPPLETLASKAVCECGFAVVLVIGFAHFVIAGMQSDPPSRCVESPEGPLNLFRPGGPSVGRGNKINSKSPLPIPSSNFHFYFWTRVIVQNHKIIIHTGSAADFFFLLGSCPEALSLKQIQKLLNRKQIKPFLKTWKGESERKESFILFPIFGQAWKG